MTNTQMSVVEGVVLENLPNTMFRVKITASQRPELMDQSIIVNLAGKMRMKRYIRLLPGDKVRCEIHALDTSRGRIVLKVK